jgi:dynactin-6
VVCQDVELKGDITIGSGTIVHPKATIFAIAGPIVIGVNCIIEEDVGDSLFRAGARRSCE